MANYRNIVFLIYFCYNGSLCLGDSLKSLLHHCICLKNNTLLISTSFFCPWHTMLIEIFSNILDSGFANMQTFQKSIFTNVHHLPVYFFHKIFNLTTRPTPLFCGIYMLPFSESLLFL